MVYPPSKLKDTLWRSCKNQHQLDYLKHRKFIHDSTAYSPLMQPQFNDKIYIIKLTLYSNRSGKANKRISWQRKSQEIGAQTSTFTTRIMRQRPLRFYNLSWPWKSRETKLLQKEAVVTEIWTQNQLIEDHQYLVLLIKNTSHYLSQIYNFIT